MLDRDNHVDRPCCLTLSNIQIFCTPCPQPSRYNGAHLS